MTLEELAEIEKTCDRWDFVSLDAKVVRELVSLARERLQPDNPKPPPSIVDWYAGSGNPNAG